MAMNTLEEIDITEASAENIDANPELPAATETAKKVVRFPSPRNNMEAALQIAENRKLKVYPIHTIENHICTCGNPKCEHEAKHPVLKGGFNTASSDDQEIRKMWRGNPNYNIGIATGKYGKSGLLVIDIDEKHDGYESLKAMQEEHEALPDTLSVHSGGGGLHLYFSYDARLHTIKSKANFSKFKGIDSRADGGGIVAPPSIHCSGNRYAWDSINKHLAVAPEWLLKLVSEKKSRRRGSLSSSLNSTKKIPEGKRNEALFSIANKMRRSGFSAEDLLASLMEANKKRCEPPLEDEEVTSIAENASSYTDNDAQGSGRQTNKAKKDVSELSSYLPFEPIDRDVLNMIRGLLDSGDEAGGDDEDDPKRLYYSRAGAVLVCWMAEHGMFIRTDAPKYYYLFRETGTLYDLESEQFVYYMYRVCGINPKDRAFDFLLHDCRTAATMAEEKSVHKFAFWNEETKTLYVSSRDGRVYRFDDETIDVVRNGEEVFFLDRSDWDPIEYDPALADGQLERFCLSDAHWDGADEEQALAFRAWIVSLFFPEHCESKPLLLLLGQAGSGKTTLLRLILRYLFGINSQVTGVPEKEDAFMAAAASSHLLVMDNLDTSINWMRDRLAMLSTGGSDTKRKLYTTNEQETIRYNCFIAFTSRTPDTLKRDDLASRLLVLKLAKIENSSSADEKTFTCESVFKNEIRAARPGFWADLFLTLSAVVKELRSAKEETQGRLRMADWERLARLVALLSGKEAVWDSFVNSVVKVQEEVLIDEDPLIEAIESGLERGYIFEDQDYLARELYDALTVALFGKDHPKAGWYKAVSTFSKRLQSLIDNGLHKRYGLTARKGTTKRASNMMVYRFEDTGKEDCILKDLIQSFEERQGNETQRQKDFGISASKYQQGKPFIYDPGVNN